MGKKNEFGENWWAKRWLSMLESFGWANRLQRGRSYARGGNVLDIDIQPGMVKAEVQGSRPRPYRVTIRVQPLSDKEWDRVISAMAGKAIFAARLLAGEMPEDIEEAFASSRVSLFPESSGDITTSCSCPDWANPCKHVAAVYYLLGERFDGDPFLLFRLRGRSREELMEALRQRRAAEVSEKMKREGVGKAGAQADTRTAAQSGRQAGVQSETQAGAQGEVQVGTQAFGVCPAKTLQDSAESFWTGDPKRLDAIEISMVPPPVRMAIIKRLGEPWFWNADPNLKGKDFMGIMERYYRKVSSQALALAFKDVAGDGNGSS